MIQDSRYKISLSVLKVHLGSVCPKSISINTSDYSSKPESKNRGKYIKILKNSNPMFYLLINIFSFNLPIMNLCAI